MKAIDFRLRPLFRNYLNSFPHDNGRPGKIPQCPQSQAGFPRIDDSHMEKLKERGLKTSVIKAGEFDGLPCRDVPVATDSTEIVSIGTRYAACGKKPSWT